MVTGRNKTLIQDRHGQSLVEFALILPLMVLFIIGIFELGRAFFAYIAITNAAREGTRVVTFWPGKTSGADVVTAIENELRGSPMVNLDDASYRIECLNGGSNFVEKPQDSSIIVCDSEKPVRVTVTYKFRFILNFFPAASLDLKRSAEMMVP